MHPRAVLLIAALVLAGCADDQRPTGPTASVGTRPTTTLSAVEREVEAAYLRSWEVYKMALRDLDESLLEECFADDALQLAREEITSLRSAGEAADMRIEHGELKIQVNGPLAEVTDRYRNHSVRVDPTSGRELEADPDTTLTQRYTLERRNESWLVTYVQSL